MTGKLCSMCIHGTTTICRVCGNCRHFCFHDKSHLYCGPNEDQEIVERERARHQKAKEKN